MLFSYGDLVVPKTIKDDDMKTVFIITGVYDFSKEQDSSDMKYEIMQVFPIVREPKALEFDENELKLLEKTYTRTNIIFMQSVQHTRKGKGWTEKPNYMIAIEEALDAEINGDTVRYDKLETTDQCLDAYNDLMELHRVFGDDAYLQLAEYVKGKFKELV